MAALGTRLLQFSVAASDFTSQVYDVHIDPEEGDDSDMTYGEAATGGADIWTLSFTAYQDFNTGTLWDKVFTSAGTTVAVLIKPYGNTTASAAQPHFTANAVITRPRGTFIGGEANSSATARQKFECTWTLTAAPTRVTS